MTEPTFPFTRALERALIAGKLEAAAGKYEATAASLRRAAQRYRASMFEVAMKVAAEPLATGGSTAPLVKGQRIARVRGQGRFG